MKMLICGLAFCLGLVLSQGPTAAQDNDLTRFVARLAKAQQVLVDGIASLEAANTLDYRITGLYYDGKTDPDIDAVIDTYAEEVETIISDGRATLDEVREGVAGLAYENQRALIRGMSETVGVLHTMLDGTPNYLRDLLKAARAGDAETFDRLSRQSMIRLAALLRTENALIDIQQASLAESHPSYALLSSVRASNEGMALFADAASRLFAHSDAKAEATAGQIRVLAAEMRAAIVHGETLRKAMAFRLFIPAMRNEGAAGMRSVVENEFVEAFAIESDIAVHLDDIADALATIYDADIAVMEALDARTVEFGNRRIAIRQTILQKVQDLSRKLE